LLGSLVAVFASLEGFFEVPVESKESGTSFSEIVDQGRDVEVDAVSGSVGLLQRSEELFGEIKEARDSRFDLSSS